MKKGWKYKPLREVCEVINGLWKGKKPPYAKIGVIRNTNFTKQLTLDFNNIEYIDVEVRQLMKRTLQKGDIIIEKSGGSEKWPVGRACVFYGGPDEKYSFSNFTSILRVKDPVEMSYEFLHKYLYFIYFRGDTRSMQKAATGIHNIEFDKYLDIQIPIIPLSEQAAIVSKLDTAFVKVESMKANNFDIQCEIAKATLSLFSSCFDFNSTPVEEKTLADIIDKDTSITYGIVQPGEDVKTGIPVVRPVDLRSKYIQLSPVIKRTTKEISDSYKRTILRGDEILICVRGTTGVVSFASESLAGGNVTRGIVPIKISDNLLRDYIYYWLQSPVASSYIESHTTGAALKQINIADMRKVPIFLPTKEKMREIVNILDEATVRLDCLSRNLEKCDAELSKFRQAVLQQIFE